MIAQENYGTAMFILEHEGLGAMVSFVARLSERETADMQKFALGKLGTPSLKDSRKDSRIDFENMRHIGCNGMLFKRQSGVYWCMNCNEDVEA